MLVENNAELFSALTKRTAGAATLIPGDCNAASVIEKIRQTIPARALSIAFVDNLGLDVTFQTLQRLTAERRMDLVVTFQVTLQVNAELTDDVRPSDFNPSPKTFLIVATRK